MLRDARAGARHRSQGDRRRCRPASSGWSFAVPHLLENLGGYLVGAPRARGDVVEPAGKEIFGLRFIPYPLPDRPVQHLAGAGSYTALPTLLELAAGSEIV